MAYTPPTIAEIKAQIITDIEGEIGQTTPILPKAFVRVLATALSGVLSLLYRFISWGIRQIFPQTADDEALTKRGAEYGLLRNPATYALLTATASGENGTIIPAATLWYIGDLVYSQTEAVEISGGTATITIECLSAGDMGNLEIGDELTLTSPIAGVVGTAVVASIMTTGEDQEAIEDFRTRVIARMRRQPQGGAAADYVGWAREVAGIVKAFAFRTSPGTVTVYPLVAVTGENRIPLSAKLTEVQTYLESTVRRPLCANVLAAAMSELTANFTITGLDPDDADTKTAIESAINSYCYAAYPRQYPDDVGATDTISVAAIWAIIAAEEAAASDVDMTVGGNPCTSYTLDENEIVKKGTVTWV